MSKMFLTHCLMIGLLYSCNRADNPCGKLIKPHSILENLDYERCLASIDTSTSDRTLDSLENWLDKLTYRRPTDYFKITKIRMIQGDCRSTQDLFSGAIISCKMDPDILKFAKKNNCIDDFSLDLACGQAKTCPDQGKSELPEGVCIGRPDMADSNIRRISHLPRD